MDSLYRATRIDGKVFAAGLVERIADEVAQIRAKTGKIPGLAVVLVGDDPASAIYVNSKQRETLAAGMESFSFRLPATVRQSDLMTLLERLNNDRRVNGILVQLPLPAHLDTRAVINAIDPDKDVDGFHVINAGRLFTGQSSLIPCTPLGCLMLLKDRIDDLTGMKAVVIGKSNIVGKPMAQLLMAENCTVTVAHIKTRNIAELCRTADIVVVAAGSPGLVRGEWIKTGAYVIDVGINRVEREGRSRIVGDVAFEECGHAAAITPVPGGVGPMTIACLLENTLTAWRWQNEPRPLTNDND
ncbi:bifunctional methylenetetrahydrofolate dehydrogenase/methenyltetrahydrofolate cyclohydrolase FolD [Pantoea sp. JGM49]|uniref:bifunctional methylenetetrahydrofolate dehydrogenase/methenyltetrahydrofolate cyclohydrolase FolD n=1 Tax=Pantoea sp. JGM49 TaxID=2799791 RepID=UPI001BAC8087|nr:bifunctional methylenetetrahydrofolate dehydrogenase/methenyltetrahydrofolate cyclohydrolase FolD [Pantoea sp. JGM49]MBS0883427.1 bifunctional methylenetetrahydrofolate dehydrogenase/methenyltetrahydrofolate cyclohydrolase FolD [Pantoea sp. JGM49]